MSRLAQREYGSGRLVFLKAELLDQISDWKILSSTIARFYRHAVTLSAMPIRTEGKLIARDPTLLIGVCQECRGAVMVSPDLRSGVKWFGLLKRCRAKPQGRAQRKYQNALSRMLKRRGGKTTISGAMLAADHFVIRSLGDQLYAKRKKIPRRQLRLS